MNIQPQMSLEKLARNQEPVRSDDHDVRWKLGLSRETGWLGDRNAEPLCDGFRRRRLQRAAATAGLVGAREQKRDVVLLRKPLEHVGAERRGRCDRDPGH